MKRTLALLASLAGVASADRQTLDITTFDAPDGWRANRGDDYVSFSTVANDEYCLINVYTSVASAGDPTADFDGEWASVFVSMFGGGAAPTPAPLTLPSGVKMIVGSGPGQQNGQPLVGALFVYVVGGRRTSVLLVLPTEKAFTDFGAPIQAFLGSVSVKGAAPPPPPQAAAAPGWSAPPALAPKDLVGEWKSGAGMSRTYIGPGGGVIGSSQTAFATGRVFAADGTYHEWLSGFSDSTTLKDRIPGTFTIDNDQHILTIRPKDHSVQTMRIVGWKSDDQSDAMILLSTVYPVDALARAEVWERVKKK